MGAPAPLPLLLACHRLRVSVTSDLDVVVEADVELSPVASQPDDETVEGLVGLYRTMVGEHDDWDDYRRAMVADKRVIVRLRPNRAYGMA